MRSRETFSRHAQRDGESFRRAEHGVGNAGIAAGGVEQHLAGTEQTVAAGLGNNVGGGAIFDGASGVIPFSLTQKGYARKFGA